MDIWTIFTDQNGDGYPVTNYVKPWPEWKRGKPISTQQLARLLKRFEIQPKQIWSGGTNIRGYEATDFEDSLFKEVRF